MAQLPNDFTGDVSTLDYVARKVIAPGNYKAIITQCDYTENKNRNGFNLVPTLQIIEGEYKGEEITQWLCIKHPKPDVQRIAIDKKARIGVILCGTPNPKDTDLLLNKPLIIETGTEPNNFTNKDGVEVQGTNNIIKNYHPINGTYKELVDGKRSAPNNAPTINYPSIITNGAGSVASYPQGSQQTGAQILDDNLDNIPF